MCYRQVRFQWARGVFGLILIGATLLASCAVPALSPTAVPPTAASSSTDPSALQEQPWQWVSYTSPTSSYQVDKPADYTLTFKKGGIVAVKADCNNATGSYTAENGKLTITLGPMTMAACPPQSRSDDFVKLLGRTDTYSIEGGQLHINVTPNGTMVFAPLT
jgi:heat shock protein HslJ